MSRSGITEQGVVTFTADVALIARRRVKIKIAMLPKPPWQALPGLLQLPPRKRKKQPLLINRNNDKLNYKLQAPNCDSA